MGAVTHCASSVQCCESCRGPSLTKLSELTEGYGGDRVLGWRREKMMVDQKLAFLHPVHNIMDRRRGSEGLCGLTLLTSELLCLDLKISKQSGSETLSRDFQY